MNPSEQPGKAEDKRLSYTEAPLITTMQSDPMLGAVRWLWDDYAKAYPNLATTYPVPTTAIWFAHYALNHKPELEEALKEVERIRTGSKESQKPQP